MTAPRSTRSGARSPTSWPGVEGYKLVEAEDLSGSNPGQEADRPVPHGRAIRRLDRRVGGLRPSAPGARERADARRRDTSTPSSPSPRHSPRPQLRCPTSWCSCRSRRATSRSEATRAKTHWLEAAQRGHAASRRSGSRPRTRRELRDRPPPTVRADDSETRPACATG
jgi:hypothetical protein